MATQSGLTFEEEGHVYRLNGAVIPSVSQIIAPLYDWSSIKPDVLEYAASRGKAIHRACELLDLDQLDESTLDPLIAGYVEGWRKFVAENECIWHEIEVPRHHPTFRYAGTPDRIGSVNGEPAVVDIKSASTINPAYGVQLAAYEMFGDDIERDRTVVQLREDGTYRVHQYEDGHDRRTFLSLLTIRSWRLKNET